jgi:hypothetical protein
MGARRPARICCRFDRDSSGRQALLCRRIGFGDHSGSLVGNGGPAVLSGSAVFPGLIRHLGRRTMNYCRAAVRLGGTLLCLTAVAEGFCGRVLSLREVAGIGRFTIEQTLESLVDIVHALFGPLRPTANSLRSISGIAPILGCMWVFASATALEGGTLACRPGACRVDRGLSVPRAPT